MVSKEVQIVLYVTGQRQAQWKESRGNRASFMDSASQDNDLALEVPTFFARLICTLIAFRNT